RDSQRLARRSAETDDLAERTTSIHRLPVTSHAAAPRQLTPDTWLTQSARFALLSEWVLVLPDMRPYGHPGPTEHGLLVTSGPMQAPAREHRARERPASGGRRCPWR